jgi:hypothetical protein
MKMLFAVLVAMMVSACGGYEADGTLNETSEAMLPGGGNPRPVCTRMCLCLWNGTELNSKFAAVNWYPPATPPRTCLAACQWAYPNNSGWWRDQIYSTSCR